MTTVARREVAYELAALFLRHLHNLNLNLVSITVTAGNFVEVTLNNPLPQNFADHFFVDQV